MNEESAFIMQGSVSSVLVAFFQSTILRMIPYSIPAVALLALDLVYGIKAAKYRGERARFSTAIRRTFTKMFSYACWIILATAMALAFEVKWVEWFVLGVVYANEFCSIVGNYLETKGLELSIASIIRLAFRKGAEKVGVEVTKEEAEEIIKPKQSRDSKGRFIKDNNNH